MLHMKISGRRDQVGPERALNISRLIASALFILLSMTATSASSDTARITGSVRKIVDGDTFDIGVVRVRLYGIDAPEAGQSCQTVSGKFWACGTEATNRLADLILGKAIECEAVDTDVYGRIIGNCRLDNANINQLMVEAGLAWAFVRYSTAYTVNEAAARAAGKGIWQGAAQEPWIYRENSWERAVASSPSGCPIKGNINKEGEKIYHTPWSPVYRRTKINEADGERWFCNEAEAIDAGWRAPYWR